MSCFVHALFIWNLAKIIFWVTSTVLNTVVQEHFIPSVACITKLSLCHWFRTLLWSVCAILHCHCNSVMGLCRNFQQMRLAVFCGIFTVMLQLMLQKWQHFQSVMVSLHFIFHLFHSQCLQICICYTELFARCCQCAVCLFIVCANNLLCVRVYFWHGLLWEFFVTTSHSQMVIIWM